MKSQKIYTEDELNEMGDKLAEVLGLRKDREHPKTKTSRQRYHTNWGTKTGLGLLLTIQEVAGQIKEGKAHKGIFE